MRQSVSWACAVCAVCATWGCSKPEASAESKPVASEPQGRTTIVGTRPSAGEELAAGAAAPEFEGQTQNGEAFRLSAQRGKPVVLYFYPKDNTPGCTAEAQAFRDDYTKLQAHGAVVVGVSADSDASHKQFAADHQLPFLLLSDPEGTLAAKYGVPFRGVHQRQTFVVGADGLIKAVFRKVSVGGHAAEVLAALEP